MIVEKLSIALVSILANVGFSELLNYWKSKNIIFYIKTPKHSHWINFHYPKKLNRGLNYPMYPFFRKPFSGKPSQYFCLDNSGAFEDPVFDITLTNKTNKAIVITGIGIKIIESFYFEYPMGGYDATNIKAKENYTIKLPDLFTEYKEIMDQRKIQFHEQSISKLSKRIVKFHRMVFEEIDSPYHLPAQGCFRFTLLLKGYESHLCNHNIIQFYIETEKKGELLMSEKIELATLPCP